MIAVSVQFHFDNDRHVMSRYPDWLNAILFENVLKKNHKNTSIKVRSVNIEPCGGANDGFLSELLRVNVNYIINSGCETKSFVVKLLTSHELALEKVGVSGYDVQNKEMLFLEVVAPQMEKVFANIDGFGCVLPKLIAVDREHDAIVFEDLKIREFVMADRMIGLDEKHVKLGLEKARVLPCGFACSSSKVAESFRAIRCRDVQSENNGFQLCLLINLRIRR